MKRKYASYQNHLNRKTKGYLTNEADWCKNCGTYNPSPTTMKEEKMECIWCGSLRMVK